MTTQTKLDVPRKSHNFQYKLCILSAFGSFFESDRRFPEGKDHVYLGASLVAQLVKNPPAMQETWFDLDTTEQLSLYYFGYWNTFLP